MHAQHGSHFATIDCDECPVEALWSNLQAVLQPWFEAGEILIVSGDFNVDVRSEEITTFFNQFQMHKLIIENRGEDSINAPNTWSCGRLPIDGIFALVALASLASRYLSAGEMPSNHRALWVDFDTETLFGHRIPRIITPTARRLQVGNTASCAKWRQLFRKKTFNTIIPSIICTSCNQNVQLNP